MSLFTPVVRFFNNFYLHDSDIALSESAQRFKVPQSTYTVAMECEPETIHVFLFSLSEG